MNCNSVDYIFMCNDCSIRVNALLGYINLVGFFQMSGSAPLLNNCWAKSLANACVHDFSEWGCMLSGPGALFPFKDNSLQNIMSSGNWMFDKVSKLMVAILGVLLGYSVVKINLKKLFSISAVSVSDDVMHRAIWLRILLLCNVKFKLLFAIQVTIKQLWV